MPNVTPSSDQTALPLCNAHPDIATTCDLCHNCIECCTCVTCRRCHHISSASSFDSCNSCNGCSDCCECIHCARCGTTCNDHYCSDCEQCLDCCSCESDGEPNVEYTTHPLTFHHAIEFTRNPSTRYLSVEIEVCSVGRRNQVNAVCDKYKASIVRDGSLPDSGFEINTAPSNGDAFVQQIEEICATLNNASAEVNDRCGLHVHIDARTFRAPTMRKLLKLYSKIEDALFLLVTQARRKNTYCTPCGEAYGEYVRPCKGSKETREKIAQATYGNKVKTVSKDLRRNKYGGERFRAMNLVSWYHRGTIECRLFGGTTSPKKIICWSMLWAGILDYAKHTKESVIDAMAPFDYDNPLANLMMVAPTPEVREWIKSRYEQYGKSTNETGNN